MVKVLLLGLLVVTMCGFANVAFVPQIAPRHGRQEASPQPLSVEDPAVRSERSTNLSHVTGTARKIQMFIKSRHLQLLPDGVVNGTADDHSVYTILQRTTVGIGQLKVQGVATCQYLCMDSCGLLYGSRDFGDECVFNEMIEQHHYNTYSSTKYSNKKRTLYLALNRRGQPRKVMLRANQQLGRLSSYTRVLTRAVTPELAEELHPIRHHLHMCSTTHLADHTRPVVVEPTKDMLLCRKRKKRRKKKKRKCVDGKIDNELLNNKKTLVNSRKTHIRVQNITSSVLVNEQEDDECQRIEVSEKKAPRTKLSENKHDNKQTVGNVKKKKKFQKGVRNKKPRVLTTTTTETSVTEEVTSDEDYTLDNTTSWDFEESTATVDDLLTPRPD